jgi:hypothetical protein
MAPGAEVDDRRYKLVLIDVGLVSASWASRWWISTEPRIS